MIPRPVDPATGLRRAYRADDEAIPFAIAPVARVAPQPKRARRWTRSRVRYYTENVLLLFMIAGLLAIATLMLRNALLGVPVASIPTRTPLPTLSATRTSVPTRTPEPPQRRILKTDVGLIYASGDDLTFDVCSYDPRAKRFVCGIPSGDYIVCVTRVCAPASITDVVGVASGISQALAVRLGIDPAAWARAGGYPLGVEVFGEWPRIDGYRRAAGACEDMRVRFCQ